MIIDREQILTALAGDAITADAYGSAPYDLKATTYGRNPAVGEPIKAFFMILSANVATATSFTIEIVADDDGAGTNEVSLVSKTVLLAALTVANGVQFIGYLDPTASLAATNRYLTLKVTVNGSDATAGKMRAWLSKGTDEVANNDGNQLG